MLILERVMHIGNPSSITVHHYVSLLLKASRLEYFIIIQKVFDIKSKFKTTLRYANLGTFQHFPFIQDFHGIDFVCMLHFNNGNLTRQQ